MFFFKKKKGVEKKKTPVRKKPEPSTVNEDRQNILLMIRKIRRRINPDVLLKAEQIALSQIGEGPSIPQENDASRLFKLATQNNGARRAEILTLVERRVNKDLH
ncbi:MAG: hypothetical protein HOD13_09700 [Rhodospirillaceae bacterium]|jgi:hypothetical protein|nr:hypothetical protein [Rhodospirillaceae bacterium]MBT5913435.1 hypothetical protein [Rhodospirillaceae bacterium]